jgi:hypothetical protein
MQNANDKDQKIRLAYNEFAFKMAYNASKLGDPLHENGQCEMTGTQICR